LAAKRANVESRPASYEDIDSCHSLLMLEMTEPYDNSLRIIVGETSLGELHDLSVPGADFVFEGVRPVAHREGDRTFSLIWPSYVAYAVSNESFALRQDAKEEVGKFLRRLQGSSFQRYVGETTWWDDRYGTQRHWRVGCSNHVIDIISVDEPSIELILGYGLRRGTESA
jgi:hypothetical protein